MNETYWRTLVDIILRLTQWREVACDSDTVVGYLFGATERKRSMRTMLYILRRLLSLEGKPAIRNLKDLERIIPFIVRNALTESKVWLHTRRSDGEVHIFVVDGSYRGRGIGRTLMSRLLIEAKEKKAKSVTVYTTDPGSNWKFYEILGFKKAAEFDDDIISFYEGRRAKGLIFTIDM